ncbi:MAG: AtpZ/AtpI family protein [Candidatus Peregrinibacteria bacterium]|nr:AtpZ/AtpI family protein [Candidatus Peregrinibacteria bacterium]
MTDGKPPSIADRKPEMSMWASLSLVWEIGYLIAIPAFLFGFGGAYLDQHVGTSPLFVLLGLSLALTASMLVVYRRVQRLLRP